MGLARTYFWRQRASYIKCLRYCVVLLELECEVEVTELQVHLLLFRANFYRVKTQITVHDKFAVQLV